MTVPVSARMVSASLLPRNFTNSVASVGCGVLDQTTLAKPCRMDARCLPMGSGATPKLGPISESCRNLATHEPAVTMAALPLGKSCVVGSADAMTAPSGDVLSSTKLYKYFTASQAAGSSISVLEASAVSIC